MAILAAGGSDALSQWERVALTSWGRYIAQAEERAILQVAGSSHRPGLVLDTGCGEGRWTALLRKHGWEAICVDTDPVALAKCQERNPGVACMLVPRSGCRLPAADASVSLLLCIEVPGVLESAWFQEEARRVLKPGGSLLGIFHNRSSVRGCFRAAADFAHGSVGFYRLGFREWRRRIRRAGLCVVRAEGLCWFPFRRLSNSRWVPVFARLEARLGLRALATFSPWVLFVAEKVALPEPARAT